MSKKPRVAIVYDWIDKWGGVERVLLHLHEMIQTAVFYTSYVDYTHASWADKLQIKTSFIQQLPQCIRKSRIASLPLYPYAFESFNFSEYDVVISVTSSFAKGIVTKPRTKHICYLLTPTRFLWVFPDEYQDNPFMKFIGAPLTNSLREWDFVAAQRPDTIIAISQTVADRAEKFYKRKAEVIYPGFDEDYWKAIGTNRGPSQQNKKYFLVVSRLEKYKKVDLVIEAFNKSGQNLWIVGTGSEEYKLQQMAHKNIHFLHSVTDGELAQLYSNATALIMPQEEDFGYVSLEAQFFGCPVIAYRRGGATETIQEDKTGIFFNEQSVSSVLDGVARFGQVSYNICKSAQTQGPKQVSAFSRKIFEEKFHKLIY